MAVEKIRKPLNEVIIEEAKKEIELELVTKYKSEYKTLLKRQADAKQIVANINREIEDLELKLEHCIG